MTDIAYKVVAADEWRAAVAEGRYEGSAVDLADGSLVTYSWYRFNMSAFRYLFGEVLKRKWKEHPFFVKKFKQYALPQVLSQVELVRIFNEVEDVTVKAVLMTMYSAGLRLSEGTQMKVSDIDSERMTLYIRKTKGNKDRFAILSDRLLKVLRMYYPLINRHSGDWLFPGRGGDTPVSNSKVQKIFKAARLKAGIIKQVSTLLLLKYQKIHH